ncbi:MAG: metalloregulator ArsR/SmtB family transcription factor [Desulfobacterales bacterium]|jgi:ArsR family transcriptional regulator|nr:metalloregulator ArsR/SmtB family transcription factor [Desulfobacterales bacterium]MDD3082880.1 metalloregulator ArsR/SmtB family transcription factor [Desulfobacterales bacterium]MDD3951707.1 metalloregulator ArsR/SmtB family transcription factor [Desulfobacterales bacterium]MDD4463093.1 metalloregulator ArsR/SmtB family transcription factor [Desulfobacterales bacterium]MDY0378158.1 metalloregulator ArsR/SmtB family transcription factor [Desulfobacterales bacterium]
MSLKEFIAVTRALQNSNRVKMLKMLQHGEFCVCEIQAALGISQAGASRNLAFLTEAGLVDRRKKGLWAFCRLAETPRSPYVAALLGNLRHWLEANEDVSKLIQSIPDIRRQNLCDG